jgi:outer membrane lipopolysaccharide assembly protein LptE/RlpB
VISRDSPLIKFAGACLLFAALSGCGYHVAGRGSDTIPNSIRTVVVERFSNNSTRYRLSDKMQQAITRDMIARTRFQVVKDPALADAVLHGAIGNVYSFPVVYDPRSGKTTIVQISAIVQFSLVDRATGKVLLQRPNFEVRNNYEISLFANQYFDESELALDRISADLARTVVSSIIENF